MEVKLRHQHSLNQLISLSAGILFVYISISAMGYGAAIAVPQDFLLPLMQFSPTSALLLTDFLTIGLPLAALFYLLAVVFKRLFRMVYLSLLVAPFIVFMLYGLVALEDNNGSMLYNLAQTIVTVLPVFVCAIFLAKQDVSKNKT